MSNKFQKSVLNRLEQENSRQRKSATAAEIADSEAERPSPVTNKTEKKSFSKAPIKKEPPTAVVLPEERAIPVDISTYLRPGAQRSAKNKTFYLDTDLIEAIKTTARAQKVADSKLVNDILRKVLGLH